MKSKWPMWACGLLLVSSSAACAGHVEPAPGSSESSPVAAAAAESEAGTPQCCLVQGTAYCAGGYGVTYSDEGPDGGCSCVVVEDSSGVYWGPGTCE